MAGITQSVGIVGISENVGINADANGWVRPTDWLAMPATAANTIDILVAVTNDDSNYCALSCTVTGGYTVNWGDGTSENVTSGATAQHKYSYAGLAGSESSRGYRQALIRITPQGANNITAFDLGKKHSRAALQSYSQPWLDIAINTASATSMVIRGPIDARILERVNVIAIGAITTLASAFSSCVSLQSVTFPAGSLASVTTLASAFSSCVSLQSVTFPAGSLASVTTLASAFQSCNSLRSVTFPEGSLANVTTIDNVFNFCNSLQSVTFPAGSLVGVTNLNSAFNSCYAIQSLAFPSSMPLVTTTTTMLSVYNSLSYITAPIPVSFSVASAKLARNELVALFNSLPTVVGQTLTITGNHGIADLSAGDRAIATGKGWTLVE